jgi:hypothetical protein
MNLDDVQQVIHEWPRVPKWVIQQLCDEAKAARRLRMTLAQRHGVRSEPYMHPPAAVHPRTCPATRSWARDKGRGCECGGEQMDREFEHALAAYDAVVGPPGDREQRAMRRMRERS